jgi:tetratricopeptide (TPR) repeat protein
MTIFARRLACAVLVAALALPLIAQGGAAQNPPQDQGSDQAAGTGGKLDALLVYRQGRDLEAGGKAAEAQAKYNEAVKICDLELASEPKRIEAFVVKAWSLFRLNKHEDVIATGSAAMKIQFDARAAEVMGESYYFLGQMDNSLKFLQKYIDAAGEGGDRVSTAYFFMGEAYLRLKKYSHADIAYSTAVSREPSMPRWWFRLGSSCEALGEWQRAFDAYSKSLALSPGYQDAQTGRDRVKAKIPQ